MTFYINQVNLPESDWTHRCIGLFDSNEWDGRGNFCGYYASEYYCNTNLIAYGVQLIDGNRIYNPKNLFDGGFKVVNRHYDEIMIGSGMWERTFEADTVEEAIEIFRTQSWR